MLRRFTIDNFKTLNDFSLPAGSDDLLGHLVCLVGLNGSGKSTILQALDFLSQLVVGNVGPWLSLRGWDKSQLSFKGSRKRNITFSMHFEYEGVGSLFWSGVYSIKDDRCTSEELRFVPVEGHDSEKLFPVVEKYIKSDGLSLIGSNDFKINLSSDYSGSVFKDLRASLLDTDLKHMAFGLYYMMRGVKSLELLSPHMMRRTSREAVDVGYGGESLAAFVDGLAAAEKSELTSQLKKLYPNLKAVSTRSTKGWKRLEITEEYSSSFELDARHVNDGLLRVAAVIAQTVARAGVEKEILQKYGRIEGDLGSYKHKGYQFILFDEIENGINPELVELLVKYLLNVRQQIILTTHSPIILNYLPDKVAVESIHFVYRRADGSTACVPLFSLGAAKERLEMMGAGEAYLDLSLSDMASIASVSGGE